jgi:branched-chain amino acid transport system ATP-binding protein
VGDEQHTPGSGAAAAAHRVPVLEVRDVSVRFGGVAALNGVSLPVHAGQVTGLIGPNGAGKTTLFNVISGLQRPDRGQVRIEGADVTRLGPHRRARLGLARTFQRLELFGTLSAVDNVRVGLEASGQGTAGGRGRRGLAAASPAAAAGAAAASGPITTAGTTTGDEPTAGGALDPVAVTAPGLGVPPGGAAATALLERVGVAAVADEPVNALPTGTARLVELARALAIGPRVLLLDEPCSGLDDRETAGLGRLLQDLAGEGRAVLLVEHDMDLVLEICDVVHVLDFGEVIASGTPAEVRVDAGVQAAYLGKPGAAAGGGPAA